MHFSKLSTALVLGIILSGCKTKAGETLQPALLQDNTASRESVVAAVKQLFNGLDVLVAQDAFEHESKIFVERRPIKTLDGNLSVGVVEEVPQVVQLVTDGKFCFLNKVGTDFSVRLDNVTCKALD